MYLAERSKRRWRMEARGETREEARLTRDWVTGRAAQGEVRTEERKMK